MRTRKTATSFLICSTALLALLSLFAINTGCSQVRSSEKKSPSMSLSIKLPSLPQLVTPTSSPVSVTPDDSSEEDSGVLENDDQEPVDDTPEVPITDTTTPTTAPAGDFIEGQLIVQFKEGVTDAMAREVISRHCAEILSMVNSRQDSDRWRAVVMVLGDKDENQAID